MHCNRCMAFLMPINANFSGGRIDFNISEIISRNQIWVLKKNQRFTKGRANIKCARFVQGK